MISPYVFAGLSNTVKVSPDKIKELICEYFKITVEDFESKKRYQELVNARSWYAFIQKYFYHKTFKQIAKESGNRDHSSIIHILSKFIDDARIYNNTQFKEFLSSVNYQWGNKFEKIITEKF